MSGWWGLGRQFEKVMTECLSSVLWKQTILLNYKVSTRRFYFLDDGKVKKDEELEI